jgi:ABC-2 type transport system ATP-binding protein
VADLDLEAGPGDRVALIGPNGSGKTSLVRLLATDLSPTGGLLRILGEPVEPPRPHLRRRIGYVPDRPLHVEPLTGRENLRFFAALRGGAGRGTGRGAGREASREVDRESGRDRGDAAAVARDFGLAARLDDPVGEYSLGMRRKLFLSEVLGAGPELLLLDEPTLGLDPAGVRVLGEHLAAGAAQGVAVVFATNEVREVPGWADRVLLLHEGRVVADASPSELLGGLAGTTRITVVVEGSPAESPSVGNPPAHDPPMETLGPGGTPPSPGGAKPGWASALADVTSDGEHLRLDPAPADHRWRIRLTTRRGGAPLPDLIRGILDAGGRVRDVRVREPDLRDVFRELTGSDLDGADGDPPPAAPDRPEGSPWGMEKG